MRANSLSLIEVIGSIKPQFEKHSQWIKTEHRAATTSGHVSKKDIASVKHFSGEIAVFIALGKIF